MSPRVPDFCLEAGATRVFLAEKGQRNPNKPRGFAQRCQARGAPVLAAALPRQLSASLRELSGDPQRKERVAVKRCPVPRGAMCHTTAQKLKMWLFQDCLCPCCGEGLCIAFRKRRCCATRCPGSCRGLSRQLLPGPGRDGRTDRQNRHVSISHDSSSLTLSCGCSPPPHSPESLPRGVRA